MKILEPNFLLKLETSTLWTKAFKDLLVRGSFKIAIQQRLRRQRRYNEETDNTKKFG